MKKPIPKVRVFGQQSIAPTFFSRTSVPVEGDKCASFSEFLHGKLSNSLLSKPKSVEERPTPFTSLLSSKDRTQFSHGSGKEIKVTEENINGHGGLQNTMLQQFKPSETPGTPGLEPLGQTTADEMDNLTSCYPEIIVKDDKISRKRKDPFQGMESMNRTGKPVIVFGDHSKATKPMEREGERRSNNTSKRQRPTYNHYANGSGWWDCDMEGVDSEEVGHSEVWEGVGSTTFGDIVDWH